VLFSLPPQVLIILVFCLIFALTFHEFGHAYVAHLCGDDTAKMAGRMTLNPIVHLDLFGSLMLLMVGFGYARPVPVNPRNYRIRNADFYVASAGPIMNLLLGFGAAFLFRFLALNNLTLLAGVPVLEILYLFILINFNLCLFQLNSTWSTGRKFSVSSFFTFRLKKTFPELELPLWLTGLDSAGIIKYVFAGIQCFQLDFEH